MGTREMGTPPREITAASPLRRQWGYSLRKELALNCLKGSKYKEGSLPSAKLSLSSSKTFWCNHGFISVKND